MPAEIAPSTGADPSNLWGNAREGSDEQRTANSAASRPQPRRRRAMTQTAAAPPVGATSPVGTGVVLDGVRLSYPGRGRPALEAVGPVDLRIAPGEFVALVGPSGCGKTSLLELVCGLLTPSGGRLTGDRAVLMPQHDGLLPWLDALDNAALAPRVRGAGRAQARATAHPLMQELGLAGFEHARPYELSGGMRQRVAFARTLLSGKPVLCLDEPFGALDALTRAELAAWLSAALAAQPRTTLLVTHDVEEACVLADRVVVLTPRPARVKAILAVDLPRPRRPTDPALVALRERALQELEIGRAHV